MPFATINGLRLHYYVYGDSGLLQGGSALKTSMQRCGAFCKARSKT